MKARSLILILVMLFLSAALQAADGIDISEVSVKPGDEADLAVSINQETSTCTGFQFDIELGDGMSLASYSDGKLYMLSNNQNNDPVCEVESIGGNAYRFMVYSNSLNAFNNGEVLSLRLKASSSMAFGEYFLTIRNVILSDVNGNTIKPVNRNYRIKVVADYLEECLSLDNSVVMIGETSDVSLLIVQELEKYSGLQFDISLPGGLSLEVGTDGKRYTLSDNQPNDLECDVENLGNSSYRFVLYFNSGKFFKNGEILKFHVKAKNDLELRDYSSQLSQIALSDANGHVTKWNDQVSTIKVTGFFTLTYLLDGTIYKSEILEYGSTITPEAAPTKEGYTFSGWSEIPSTMPANDVTVIGAFTINKYKLTYVVDGAKYKFYEVEYGSPITPEAAPTREGYTFSGWSPIPETMPAKDIIVTGSFTKAQYEVDGVTYEINDDGVTLVGIVDAKGDVVIAATVIINGKTYKITVIGEGAFKGCNMITSLTITDGIGTIMARAFDGCNSIRKLILGKGIKTIGSRAFAGIGKWTSARSRVSAEPLTIECYAESVPQADSDSYDGTDTESAILKVKDELVENYKTISPWNLFGTILGFKDPSTISPVYANEEGTVTFSIDGRRLKKLQKGMNIIRTNQGARKMMVK